MKKYVLISLLSILLVPVSAQDSIYQVHFNESLGLWPWSATQINQSFYTISKIRLTNQGLNCCNGLMIVKFDSLGFLSWQRKYFQQANGIYTGEAYYLKPDETLIIGEAMSVLQDTGYILFFTIDNDGNPMGAWRYLGDYKLPGQLSVSRENLDYYIAGFGHRYPQNFTQRDLVVCKTDSLFQPVWAYTYENSGTSYGSLKNASSKSEDGIVIAGGFIDTLNGPNYAVLLKIDTSGNILWSYRYEGGALTEFDDIKLLPDGSYLIAGYTSEPTKYSGLLAKVDSAGNVIWSHEYSMNGFCNTVSLTNDGGFIVTGEANDLGADATFILKTDSMGNAEWMHFNGIGRDIIGAEQTADGGYIFADMSIHSGSIYNLHIGKTDSLGNLGCYDYPYSVTSHPTLIRTPLSFNRIPWQVTMSPASIQVDTTPLPDSLICSGVSGIALHYQNLSVLEIFPNPAFSTCTVTAPVFNNSTLTLYDITGRILQRQAFNQKSMINLNELNKGIYLLQLMDASGMSAVGKLVKE